MARVVQGKFNAQGMRFGIVVGRFNELIGAKLLEGAIDTLVRHGCREEDITVVWVPGSFEIPMVARRLALSGDVDGVITLGAVIRGATPHFDYIAAEVAKGVAQVGLEAKVPVVFGVLTTDTLEQALERAGTKAGNKGAAAAMAAIEMVDLFRQL